MSTESICEIFLLWNIWNEIQHFCKSWEWFVFSQPPLLGAWTKDFFFHPTSEFTGALATESTSENGSNECQWRFPEEKGHGWSSSVQPKLFPLAAILRKYTTLSHPLRSCNPRLSKNLPLNPIYIQIPPKIFSPYFRQSTVSLRHYISFTCHWSMWLFCLWGQIEDSCFIYTALYFYENGVAARQEEQATEKRKK